DSAGTPPDPAGKLDRKRRRLHPAARRPAEPPRAESRSQPLVTPPESYGEDLNAGATPADAEPAETESPEPEEIPPRRAEPVRQMKPPRRKRPPHDPTRDAEILRRLKSPVTSIAGIGPKNAEKMAQLELHTVEDMLYCFPRRYDHYTQMLPLAKVRADQVVTVVGAVRDTVMIKGKRNIDVLNVIIDDGTGVMTVSFFNQPYLRARFERGTQVVFSGKTSLYVG